MHTTTGRELLLNISSRGDRFSFDLVFWLGGSAPRLDFLIAIFTKGVFALSYCMICSHTQVMGPNLFTGTTFHR